MSERMSPATAENIGCSLIVIVAIVCFTVAAYGPGLIKAWRAPVECPPCEPPPAKP